MSNAPPPSFGQPAWQAPSGPTGLAEGAAPEPQSKTPVIIVAVIVVAAVAALLFFVLGGDDDEAAVDAAGASDALGAIVDSAADNDTSGFGLAQLGRCPMGSTGDLLDRVADKVEVYEPLLDGSDLAAVLLDEDADFVFCTRSLDDENDKGDGVTALAVQAIHRPPRDFEQFLKDQDVDADDPTDFDEAGTLAGGTMYKGCGDESCTAIWYHPDERIAFALTLAGEDLDVDATVGLLKSNLASMASSLAAHVDDPEVTGPDPADTAND